MKLADYGHRAPRRENLRNVAWRTDEVPDAAEESMVMDKTIIETLREARDIVAEERWERYDHRESPDGTATAAQYLRRVALANDDAGQSDDEK